MEGSAYADWCYVINFDSVASHVYMYDHINRTAYNASCHDLAWPINWDLGRYHKKFIACGKQLPDPGMATADLK